MVEVWLQYGYFFGKAINYKTHQNTILLYRHVHTCTHTHTFFLTQYYVNFRFFQNLLSVFTSVIKINNLNANSDVSLTFVSYGIMSYTPFKI